MESVYLFEMFVAALFELEKILKNLTGYDCPKLNNLWKFATTIAGGTLTAIESIYSGANIAINWCGGWHHAQRYSLQYLTSDIDLCSKNVFQRQCRRILLRQRYLHWNPEAEGKIQASSVH